MKGEFDELKKSILSREHIRFRLPKTKYSLPYRPKDWLDDKNSKRPFRRKRIAKRMILWLKIVQQFGETVKSNLL